MSRSTCRSGAAGAPPPPAPAVGPPASSATSRGRPHASDPPTALLDEPLQRALLAFPRVALGDEGGVVATPGWGNGLDELKPFFESALAAARALDAAIARVLPSPASPYR